MLVLWVGHRGGPGTCASLARGGYRVLRAHPEGAHGGWAPRLAPPLRYPSPTEDPEGFVRFLQDACHREEVAAVLPLDEDIVRLLAERGPDLGRAVVVGPDAAQYRALCDKGRLAETARRAGVEHPFTVEIADGRPVAEWPDLPCVVKPRISGSSGLWEKPTLVTTAAERDEAIRRLLAADVPALVQQRLTGPRWVGHGVASRHGLDFLGFRVDRDWPRGAGPASVMHTAAVPAPVLEGTRRLLAHVGYQGPVSLSFIQRGDRLLVHDVNLRLGATVGASIRSGFDIPGRAIEAALGRPSPPLPRLSSVRYVRFDGEVRELARALGRRPGADSAIRLGRWLLAGLLSRRTVLDPSPLDRSWALAAAGRRLRRALPRVA